MKHTIYSPKPFKRREAKLSKPSYFEYQKWNQEHMNFPLIKKDKCQKCNKNLEEIRVSFWWHGPVFDPTPTWFICSNGHKEWDYSFHHIL